MLSARDDAKPLSVLVVDDDALMLKTLSDILRLRGYDASTAATGGAALQLLSSGAHPAVALVDLVLPDMGGLDVVRALRQISRTTEVVVLTGHASVNSAVTALREHSFDYLIKPVAPDNLLQIIGKAGERWRSRRLDQQRQGQKMEAIGRLAGGVAHDFNNILTAILGYTDLASRRPGIDAARRDLDEIRRAAERAVVLIQQLMAFSRQQAVQPRLLDLNQAIMEMADLLRRLIGGGIRLEIGTGPLLGAVLADPVQVTQIVMNLAVNARDAMPDGGDLYIQTRNADLAEPGPLAADGAVPAGQYVVLSVRDTGTGMDGATVQQIFDPFFTTKERGTGLGLATVHDIVSQSGGHVSVSSVPGRGTEFAVYLPRRNAASN